MANSPSLIAQRFASVDLLRHVFLLHSIKQSFNRVGLFAFGLDDRLQHQTPFSIPISAYLPAVTLSASATNLNSHREALAPFAELNEHGILLRVNTAHIPIRLARRNPMGLCAGFAIQRTKSS